jgi:hypothetical protein
MNKRYSVNAGGLFPDALPRSRLGSPVSLKTNSEVPPFSVLSGSQVLAYGAPFSVTDCT